MLKSHASLIIYYFCHNYFWTIRFFFSLLFAFTSLEFNTVSVNYALNVCKSTSNANIINRLSAKQTNTKMLKQS